MNNINIFVHVKKFFLLTLLSLTGMAEAQSLQDKLYDVNEQGKPVVSVTHVFSQNVAFNYPKGFVPAFSNVKDNLYTQEHVLKGQTVETWTQMFSLRGFKDFSKNPNITVNNFGGRFLAMSEQICPKSYFGGKLMDFKVGNYDAALWFFSCGSIKHANGINSESTMMVVLKAENDFYNIQWAERGAPQNSPMEFDKNKWLPRFTAIMPIKIL